MNENETIVNDEQINEETGTKENALPQKNILSKISGILTGIVFALAVVLLVFGFIHLGFDQGQAITEFIFALVGVIIAVAMVLISPSASKRDTKRGKVRTIISIIGNTVCALVLVCIVVINTGVVLKNTYEYKDEEQMIADICGLYEGEEYWYIINSDELYKIDYNKLFVIDNISDDELVERFKGMDDITIEKYLDCSYKYITCFSSLTYDYENASLKFAEGIFTVNRSGDLVLDGEKLKTIKRGSDAPSSPEDFAFVEEFEVIKEKYDDIMNKSNKESASTNDDNDKTKDKLTSEAEKEQAWRSCMELQLWDYTVEQLMYWVFEDYEVEYRKTSDGVYEVEISGRYYPYYMQKYIVQEGSIIFIVDLYAEGSPAYISDKEKDVAKAFEFAAMNMTY